LLCISDQAETKRSKEERFMKRQTFGLILLRLEQIVVGQFNAEMQLQTWCHSRRLPTSLVLSTMWTLFFECRVSSADGCCLSNQSKNKIDMTQNQHTAHDLTATNISCLMDNFCHWQTIQRWLLTQLQT